MAKRKAVRRTKKAAKTARKAAPRKAARKPSRKKTAARKPAAARASKGAKRGAKPAARRVASKKRVAPKKGATRPKKVATRKVVAKAAPPRSNRKAVASRPAVRPAVRPLLEKTPAYAKASTKATDRQTVERKAPALNRARRVILDDDVVVSPPSSLDMDRTPSAARSGGRALHDRIEKHHETSPAMTAGDVDADWEQAYSSGDEAPGGDNMTPDQDVVDEIGAALGVEYDDDEELQGGAEISERDEHRWDEDE
jgi:hypothetical protein